MFFIFEGKDVVVWVKIGFGKMLLYLLLLVYKLFVEGGLKKGFCVMVFVFIWEFC